jgi:hypothetical protein
MWPSDAYVSKAPDHNHSSNGYRHIYDIVPAPNGPYIYESADPLVAESEPATVVAAGSVHNAAALLASLIRGASRPNVTHELSSSVSKLGVKYELTAQQTVIRRGDTVTTERMIHTIQRSGWQDGQPPTRVGYTLAGRTHQTPRIVAVDYRDGEHEVTARRLDEIVACSTEAVKELQQIVEARIGRRISDDELFAGGHSR